MSARLLVKVMKVSPYTGGTFATHLALAFLADDSGIFSGTSADVEVAARLGSRAVSDAMKVLREDGIAERLVTGRSGAPSVYRVLSAAPARPKRKRKPAGDAGSNVQQTQAPSRAGDPLTDLLSGDLKVSTTDTADAGRGIAQAVWSASNPKPAQPFIAIAKIAERFLKAGHSVEAITAAMLDAPTISIGWVESRLNRDRKPSGGKVLPMPTLGRVDTDRDKPTGRVTL